MFVGDACHATRNSTEQERKESATRTQLPAVDPVQDVVG